MFYKTNRNWLKHIDFMILDIILLIVSFLVGNFLRHHTFVLNQSYINILVVMVILEIAVILFYEPYKNVLKRGYIKEFRITLEFVFLVVLTTALYLFVTKESSTYSRLVIGYTFTIFFAASYLCRILHKRIVLRTIASSDKHKSLFIISDKKNIKKNIARISEYTRLTHTIKGICVLDDDEIGKTIEGCEIVANKENALEYACRNWIDDVFVGVELKKVPKELMEGLSTAGITTHVVFGEEYQFSGQSHAFEKFGSYPVLSSFNRTYSNKQIILKRLMDIAGGLVGCLITLILALIIGPIIYVKSPGNIFYSSERIGLNGKRFKMYKFRSMILNAEDMKKDLMENNIVKDGMMFKMKDDPRIIPGIGSFIRKTSLDEFPQFYNVLKGDMSLVGTRPPTVDEWEKYKPEHRMRMSTKPGITGMWQISGRNKIVDFDEVVKLDKQYIDNWDLGLDIKILFKTVLYLFEHKDDAM